MYMSREATQKCYLRIYLRSSVIEETRLKSIRSRIKSSMNTMMETNVVHGVTTTLMAVCLWCGHTKLMKKEVVIWETCLHAPTLKTCWNAIRSKRMKKLWKSSWTFLLQLWVLSQILRSCRIPLTQSGTSAFLLEPLTTTLGSSWMPTWFRRQNVMM